MKLPNQKGFSQVLILVLILTGIGFGTYLVQQKTNLFPKAYNSQSIITPIDDKCIIDRGCLFKDISSQSKKDLITGENIDLLDKEPFPSPVDKPSLPPIESPSPGPSIDPCEGVEGCIPSAHILFFTYKTYPDLRTILEDTSAVILGRVKTKFPPRIVDLRSPEENDHYIVTDLQVKVEKVLWKNSKKKDKNSKKKDLEQIIITQPGGQIDTHLDIVPAHEPISESGKLYVFFINKKYKGKYWPVGGPQGHYMVENNIIKTFNNIEHYPLLDMYQDKKLTGLESDLKELK